VAGGHGDHAWVADRGTGARADLLFEVNRTNDLPDTAIGDHNCDSRPTLPGDQCTLRAVIQETNLEEFSKPRRGVAD
jgi:hypothetical protein